MPHPALPAALVLALAMAIATVSILWYVAKRAFPDDVKELQFFLTFIVVVVPFVMLFYGGLTILVYDQMMTASGSLAVVALAQTGNPSMRQNNHQ